MPFIVPHFNYCAQTWHFCNNGSAKTLEKVNERAVRFVFRDKQITHEELLKHFKKRLSKILCSVFKLVNNKTNPESLNELISLRETTYAMRGKDISLRDGPLENLWGGGQSTKKNIRAMEN